LGSADFVIHTKPLRITTKKSSCSSHVIIFKSSGHHKKDADGHLTDIHDAGVSTNVVFILWLIFLLFLAYMLPVCGTYIRNAFLKANSKKIIFSDPACMDKTLSGLCTLGYIVIVV